MFDYEKAFYISSWTISIILKLFGLIGNTLLISIISLRNKEQTPANVLIANLAFSDCLLIVFCFPIEILYKYYVTSNSSWYYDIIMCKVVPYVEVNN
jgi:neuropeptide Y receptor type 5